MRTPRKYHKRYFTFNGASKTQNMDILCFTCKIYTSLLFVLTAEVQLYMTTWSVWQSVAFAQVLWFLRNRISTVTTFNCCIHLLINVSTCCTIYHILVYTMYNINKNMVWTKYKWRKKLYNSTQSGLAVLGRVHICNYFPGEHRWAKFYRWMANIALCLPPSCSH